MPTFNLFRFKIEPELTHPLYAKMSAGFATVLVIDDNPNTALSRAMHHVKSAKWVILSQEIFPTTTEESQSQIPETVQMIRTAKSNGIGCIYDIAKGGGSLFN